MLPPSPMDDLFTFCAVFLMYVASCDQDFTCSPGGLSYRSLVATQEIDKFTHPGDDRYNVYTLSASISMSDRQLLVLFFLT